MNADDLLRQAFIALALNPRHHVGCFSTLDEAIRAYNLKKEELYGNTT